MKPLVKGAALFSITGGRYVRPGGSAAQRFRERQLAAWREATGLASPTVVPIAVNGREFTTEAEARKALAAAA